MGHGITARTFLLVIAAFIPVSCNDLVPLLLPPALAIIHNLLRRLLGKMATALVSVDPTEVVPTAEKRSFRSELRKREAEYEALKEENFDLKMQINHLQGMMIRKKEPRRLSSTPPVEKYYNFDDDDETRLSNNSREGDSMLDTNNPMLKTLRDELALLREENKSLTLRNHDLSDALDDLREKHIADSKAAADRDRAAHQELQSLVNQVEDLQSENLKYGVEMTQARELLEQAKLDVNAAHEERDEMRRKEVASKARANGLQMQFKAAMAALEESRTSTEVATEKMGVSSIELMRIKQELKEMTEMKEQVQAKQVQEAQDAAAARQEKDRLRAERDTAIAKLNAEKEREKLKTEAFDIAPSNELFAGDSSALENLTSLLKRQQAAYEEASTYQPRWRERVLGDMNDCLRALYRSQKEIELKREQFVETFGVGDPMFESHSHLVSSA